MGYLPHHFRGKNLKIQNKSLATLGNYSNTALPIPGDWLESLFSLHPSAVLPKERVAPGKFQVKLLSSNGEVPPEEVQVNWPNAKEPME